MVQSLGTALFEELKLKDGKVLNKSFVDYKIPTADDVPEGLTQRHIRLDVLPDPVRQRALRRTMRSDARQQQLALASAVEQLRMANLLHNELEAVYRPCMDFAALTTFTDRYLRTFPGT